MSQAIFSNIYKSITSDHRNSMSYIIRGHHAKEGVTALCVTPFHFGTDLPEDRQLSTTPKRSSDSDPLSKIYIC